MNHPLSHVQHCLQSFKLELLTQRSPTLLKITEEQDGELRLKEVQSITCPRKIVFDHIIWHFVQHFWLKMAQNMLCIVKAEIF